MELRPILLSEPFRRDPESLYGWLRDEQPVCYAPDLDCYFLSRYADIRRTLHDPRISRAAVHSRRHAQQPRDDGTPLRDRQGG